MLIVLGVILALWTLIYAVIGLSDIVSYMKTQAKLQRSWRYIVSQYDDEIITVFLLIAITIWILRACNKLFYF